MSCTNKTNITIKKDDKIFNLEGCIVPTDRLIGGKSPHKSKSVRCRKTKKRTIRKIRTIIPT